MKGFVQSFDVAWLPRWYAVAMTESQDLTSVHISDNFTKYLEDISCKRVFFQNQAAHFVYIDKHCLDDNVLDIFNFVLCDLM